MAGQDTTAEQAALRRSWQRWTAIVALFALRRPGRHRVDPREYARLHQDLLQACRGLAGTAEELGRPFYRHLESLVEPWLTPQVLAEGDREVLLDLLGRVRRAGRGLEVGRRALAVRRWCATGVLFLAVALGVVALAWCLRWADLPRLEDLRYQSRTFWSGVKAASGPWPLLVAGVLTALVAIFIIRRPARW
jgi:hypothetical protein